MRYTEAKMSKISGDLLRDIEKNTVDYRPNPRQHFERTNSFASAVPNLLLNRYFRYCGGYGDKYSSPHNLAEVVDATTHLIDNPKRQQKTRNSV